jgi:MoaA/NifB/PqqE/SkfB family radical SAM enzyme
LEKFPLEANIFDRHFYYEGSAQDWRDLQQRMLSFLDQLNTNWRLSKETNDSELLYSYFVEAINSIDDSKLCPAELPLRPMIRQVDGRVPIGVISKFTRLVADYCSDNNQDEAEHFIQTLCEINPLGKRQVFIRSFLAARADFYYNKGLYDQALESATVIFQSQPSCPYAQFLFSQILAKLPDTKQLDKAAMIGVQDLSDRFCDRPFKTITTSALLADENSRAALYACNCSAMVPYPFASWKPENKETIDEVWNGREIKEIRRSILDGDYKYCSRSVCPEILNNSLPKKEDVIDPFLRDIIDNHKTEIGEPPRTLQLAHDTSCNLACPSCRSEIITAKNDLRNDLDHFSKQWVLPLINKETLTILLSHDGDPIGSKHYRQLLSQIDETTHENISILLQTNGLLLTPKEWAGMSKVKKLIKAIGISIDAATAPTYEDVRRPGKWSTLVENMEFLSSLRKSGEIPYIYLCYVIQKKTYKEMPDFVRLGKNWGVDKIVFGKLMPQVHPSVDDTVFFEANAVAEERHPEYQNFLEILSDPILSDPLVDMFNVSSYMDEKEEIIEDIIIPEDNDEDKGGFLRWALKNPFSLFARAS